MSLVKCTIVGCLCVSLMASQTSELHGKKVESPDSFGYVSFSGTAGTANATISNIGLSGFVPLIGPIPQQEMALNYGGYIMEIKGDIRNG